MTRRLSSLYFLQFGIWGCYLVSMGQFLGGAGLGDMIPWFYAMAGFAALVMPLLAGYIADRHTGPVRLLAVCHALSATAMAGLFAYALGHPRPDGAATLALFGAATAFYTPTMPLCNATALAALRRSGADTTKLFPRTRLWGTVGFVAMMWMVNTVWIVPGEGIGICFGGDSTHAMDRMQYTCWQLGAAAILGFVTAAYALLMPHQRPAATYDSPISLRTMLKILRKGNLGMFFLFAMLIGVAQQINNGYATPYITHYRALEGFVGTFGADNATLLMSLSQISEVLWMLCVGAVMARAGVKVTMLMAMTAWSLNFLCFALGDPGSGLWVLAGGMIVYGVAFDFNTVAASLFVEREVPEGSKATAQCLLVMMGRGVGASAGMFAAGAVVNCFCRWTVAPGGRYLMGDWLPVWLIFAAYCAVVAVAFAVFFRSSPAK